MNQIHPSFNPRTDSSDRETIITVPDFTLLEYISGYGRELFISNFLAFISTSQAYHPVVEEAFKSLGLPCSFSEVKREFKHTDLTYFDKNHTMLLVVENKAGDNATKRQLENYEEQLKKNSGNENIKNARRLLISPLKVEEYTAKSADWEFISYSDLAIALKEAFFKHFHSEKGFEYDFIILVLDYMAALCDETTTAVDTVTPDTKIKDLLVGIHPKLMCYTATKQELRRKFLGYAGICKLLNRKLESVGSKICAYLSKDMRGNPIVEMMVPLSTGKEFYCLFQNNHLSIGFSKKENVIDKPTKDKRTQALETVWKNDFNGPENIKVIFEATDGQFPGFPMSKVISEMKIYRGYITNEYIMPMLHHPKQPEMTVGGKATGI